ncbi:MAG: LysM peptidoglycan-binding domain-containing protein [Firmicutes bacterium]|nr:LysM peptidoglycan-binding domain-containing protein [Bacillota bacterium]
MLSTDKGHAGIYIGERIINSKTYNVVECTPKWGGGVILSYVNENGKRYQYKGALLPATVGWAAYGKLPWIDYSEQPTPPTPETPVYYTVVRGDALYKIAKKFGCTIADLVKWNNIANPNLIYVGQKLIVGYKNPEPQPPTPPEPEKVYYTVKRGDNLSKIAKKYGTTVAQLVAWNNIANPNLIYTGQVLRVK